MNILLTSAGRRTYIINYFKEALQGKGKVFAANSILTYTLTQADEYVITPLFYSEEYVPFLLSYCQKESISAIISLIDADAQILSHHIEDFKNVGTTLIVADEHVMDICNDKWNTYKFLQKLGVNQPLTFRNVTDAKTALTTGDLHYPIIIKPRWGIGSFGIYKIDNEQELDVLYAKLHKDIFSTYMGQESKKDIDACIILQQYLEGEEYGIEVLNDLNSNYVATFAKQKLAMRAGETDIAVTVDVKQFETLAQTISVGLKHIALLDMDCIMTSDEKLYVLEMNCRFGGQYPFTHNAGVNVPNQIILWLNGQSTIPSLVHQRTGIISCKELLPIVMKY